MFVGDEREQLTQFLDWQRATILMKVDGLDRQQMSLATAASDLTMAGLLKHLALVEAGWFGRVLLGEPPATWYRDFVDDPDWFFSTAAKDDPADTSSSRSRSASAVARRSPRWPRLTT